MPLAPGEKELLVAFELHDVDGIREALDRGMSATAPIGGLPPVEWLTRMYLRSPRFPACLRLLLDRGATLPDAKLAPVLLDDAEALAAAIAADPALAAHRTDMVSAFTPLLGASLLHVAAEFGHARAANVLLEAGADVEARAATDAHGFNGHTPIFHAVNAIDNHGKAVLRLLLDRGARVDTRLPGITWGKGFEWETTFLDVTPITYAQWGLAPQMHRDEGAVYANIRLLLHAAGRAAPAFTNVPNRYLAPKPQE